MPRLRQDFVDRQERDGYVTVAEASRRSGVCERTLRSWGRAGSLKVRRVGPMLVFVEVASLRRATGLGESASTARVAAEPAAHPVRELTFERDE